MVDSLVRLDAVRAVLGGRGVVEVARACGVSRQSVHTWLSRYLVEGVSGLADRSHRPKECPHQAPPAVEAQVAEMRPGASAVGCETDQIHRAYLERRRPAAPGVDRFLVAAPARALDKRHRSFEAVLRRAPSVRPRPPVPRRHRPHGPGRGAGVPTPLTGTAAPRRPARPGLVVIVWRF